MEITLPNHWRPRCYQRRLWNYLEGGGKRAVAVWHRRAGKDDVCLHWAACAAMQRVGNYWHMLPEASQARSTGTRISMFASSSTSSAVEMRRASHLVA
jgi:phage terminase large subunit